MLRALLRAVDARARSCSGGEKITPSRREPAILLICDEVAVILGVGTGGPRLSEGGVTNATLAGLATRLVMTGRSEAIDLVMATQRGTVTMTGSADLKSQCTLRIGLGVASEADARLIIPDNVRIAADLSRLHHPGSGIVQQGRNGRVLPVKFYRIEHEQIDSIAERFGWLRPAPDPLVAQALGDDYRTRWTRYRTSTRLDEPGQPVLPSAVIPPAIPAPVMRELTAGASTGGNPALSENVGDHDHPIRHQVVGMLRVAGVRGLTVRAIAERLASGGHEVAHQTVHRWLAEEAAAGRAESASYGRWKWREDAEAGELAAACAQGAATIAALCQDERHAPVGARCVATAAITTSKRATSYHDRTGWAMGAGRRDALPRELRELSPAGRDAGYGRPLARARLDRSRHRGLRTGRAAGDRPVGDAGKRTALPPYRGPHQLAVGRGLDDCGGDQHRGRGRPSPRGH